MVTYTILHEFTTCDPCHVPNKAIMIIFDISYFQEEQKNEYYLFWINISFDKNTLLSNTYIYISDLNRRKAGFIKFSVKHCSYYDKEWWRYMRKVQLVIDPLEAKLWRVAHSST